MSDKEHWVNDELAILPIGIGSGIKQALFALKSALRAENSGQWQNLDLVIKEGDDFPYVVISGYRREHAKEKEYRLCSEKKKVEREKQEFERLKKIYGKVYEP